MNKRILMIIALAGLIILSPYVVGEALARSDQLGIPQGSDCPKHDEYSQDSFDISVKTWDAFHLHQDLHQTSFYAS